MKISEEQQELYDSLAQWVVAYQQGDSSAFDNIYHTTFRHVFTYVKLHEIPENEREDLVQDIYITAAQNLGRLKEPQAFYKWLMRITANKVVDYFRKNKKRLEAEVFEAEKQDDAPGAEEQLYRQKSSQERAEDEMISVPEKILDNKETQKILFSLVRDSLKPMQTEILYLRCYGEKSFKEIAEELGVPESTVKTQFRRSLDKVQTAILKTEKEQGIRLHSVGIIPFVAGMFFVYAGAQEASAAEAGAVYAGIQSQLSSSASAAGSSAAATGNAAKGTSTATGVAAKTAGLAIGKKVLIAVLCAAVAAGGAGAAIHHARSEKESQQFLQELAKNKKTSEKQKIEKETLAEEQNVEENPTSESDDQIKEAVWETSSEEARKAFYDFLSDSETIWNQESNTDLENDLMIQHDIQPEDLQFIATDLNGVPVLCVYNNYGTHHAMEKLFAYQNGSVQEITSSDDIVLYPNDGIYSLYRGGMGEMNEQYYKMTSEGTEKIAESSETYAINESDTEKFEYMADGKTCSKADFEDYLKEVLKHSDTNSPEVELIVNTEENRKKYFKIQTSENSDDENVVKDTVLSDGTYNMLYTGENSSEITGGLEYVDMKFSWMKIENNIMTISMDIGNGEQTYEIPLASDVELTDEGYDDSDVTTDLYNRLFYKNTSTYGFSVLMTIQDGKVKKLNTGS